MPKRAGRPSVAQTPAPKSDKVYGSKKNPKGSATNKASKSIKLSTKTIDTLKEKLDDFKKKHPAKKNVDLNDLKAVYRRGSGAYSKSHRPTISGGAPNSRAAWSYARVNKFLKKAGGEKVKAAYVQDDDLFARGGETKGDCYKAAANFCIGSAFRPDNLEFVGEPYLVHAEVRGQGKAEGIRFGHAWVEDDENVYDYSNGRKLIIPKPVYYAIGDIQTDDPKKYQKYTFQDARAKMLETKHYGSWDIETEFKDGGQTELVTCINCSWQWDTADSAENDKYVCHQCGFDNSLFYDGGILKPTMPIEEIAEKHSVSMEYIQEQLEKGKKHELEHTDNQEVAEKIALHHLAETPDYYEKIEAIGLEDGGEIDLFEHYDELPEEVQAVLNRYATDDETYENAEALLQELQPLGYTFEYGLDASPYNLRKIEDVEDVILEDNSEPEPFETFEFVKSQREEAEEVLHCSGSRTFKALVCKTKVELCDKRLEEAEHPEEQNIWHECRNIWNDHLAMVVENNIPQKEYKDGGQPCGCGKMYGKGGLAYGNSHAKGGMPMQVKDTGQHIEIEGGEGVINKRSMQMNKKVEFEGKEMTPCEVISHINQMGGGVKFKCSDVKNIIAEDGHF